MEPVDIRRDVRDGRGFSSSLKDSAPSTILSGGRSAWGISWGRRNVHSCGRNK